MTSLYGAPTGIDLCLRALRRYPDNTAFAWDGGTLSYAGALHLIGRLQAAMAGAGLGRGTRMALLSANRADAWCIGVAAQGLGMVTTWLHPMGSIDDHLDVLDDAGIEALVIDATNYCDRGGELAAGCSGLKHVFTLGQANYGVDLLDAAERAGETSPRSVVEPDDLAGLAYTGGTTGKSKGAIRRHASWAAVTTSILASFELPRRPRYLAVAPITHVAGTKVLPTLMLGGSVHLMKGFDPERVLSTIQDKRINMTLLVPTMIYVLLDHPSLSRADLSSLELLMYGASPMSPSRLVEGLDRIGPVFCQLYGQTEGYPLSVLRKADHDTARPELFASCGHPVPDAEIRLLDDDLREVPVGEAGEICARGPQVMDYYWKRPEQTEETLRGDWLHTGDIARRDERGYLYIVDRKKDMIVTGGFNVFPREVEDVLTSHPDVAMAAVIGVPDDKWGEAVTALVVRRPGATPGAATLMQLVRDRKGPAQAPKKVEFVDSLPLTAVGKVDKKVLRARFWAGRQRMVG
jgi:fatty-acyl-CoA synthase